MSKILVVDDEMTIRMMLDRVLTLWGYQAHLTTNGHEALEILRQPDPPKMVIVDWVMPGMDGLDLCRRIKQNEQLRSTYLILLTAKGSKENVVQGLEAGADDYITKPFDVNELRARIGVAERLLQTQGLLSEKIEELEKALAHVKTLQGTIPICAHCHKIRDDQQAWQKLEAYIEEHSEADFSHSICPKCAAEHFPDIDIYDE